MRGLILLFFVLGALVCMPAALASQGVLPKPASSTDLPDVVAVGETFAIKYEYWWEPSDASYLLDGSHGPFEYMYRLQIYLPDEFSILTSGFTSTNFLADKYQPHVLKKHEAVVKSNVLGSNYGSVSVSMDKNMTFGEDYASFFGLGDHADKYFILEQEGGAKFVKEYEEGRGKMDFNDVIGPRYAIMPHPSLEYAPRPMDMFDVSDGSKSVAKEDWEELAKHMRYVQEWNGLEYMDGWMAQNNYAGAFVGAFFRSYPEFTEHLPQRYHPEGQWPDLVNRIRGMQYDHGLGDVPGWLHGQNFSRAFIADFLSLYPIFR